MRRAEISAGAVPLLPGARELALAGCISGGTKRNLKFVSDVTAFDNTVEALDRLILADAQTSGGLLLCVREDALQGLIADLGRRGTLAAAVIGTVTAGTAGTLRVGA